MKQLVPTFGKIALRAKWLMKHLAFLFIFFPVLAGFGQQQNKIQREVDEIKAIYSNTDKDYITDGQRTVWVKSYKKWVPNDLVVMKKEDPDILKFLNQAIQHNRYDVLEQLLPDYYATHGGVKAFAADVLKEQVTTKADVTNIQLYYFMLKRA